MNNNKNAKTPQKFEQVQRRHIPWHQNFAHLIYCMTAIDTCCVLNT